MLNAGPAKKVSIYISQDQKYHGDSVYAAILEFLFSRKVSGAMVIRGIAGFGAEHHMQTDRILALTENLPMEVQFVETADKVAELLPQLKEMVATGVIAVSEVEVIK